MIDREIEVAKALEPTVGHPEGFSPRQFGATQNSHHGQTATRMVKKGWVERRFRGGAWGGTDAGNMARGSCLYRLTPAGVRALANAKALKRAAEKVTAP